jgi:Fe-S cluster assembly protein SufD
MAWRSAPPGKVAKPVSLIYLHKSETSDAILHHLVKVEDGGQPDAS